jgi:hypothetical protein
VRRNSEHVKKPQLHFATNKTPIESNRDRQDHLGKRGAVTPRGGRGPITCVALRGVSGRRAAGVVGDGGAAAAAGVGREVGPRLGFGGCLGGGLAGCAIGFLDRRGRGECYMERGFCPSRALRWWSGLVGGGVQEQDGGGKQRTGCSPQVATETTRGLFASASGAHQPPEREVGSASCS